MKALFLISTMLFSFLCMAHDVNESQFSQWVGHHKISSIKSIQLLFVEEGDDLDGTLLMVYRENGQRTRDRIVECKNTIDENPAYPYVCYDFDMETKGSRSVLWLKADGGIRYK